MDTHFGFDFGSDDDTMQDTTVAWQVAYLGAWTTTHETRDLGRTTLCGLTVPAVVANADAFSDTKGRCKTCMKLS